MARGIGTVTLGVMDPFFHHWNIWAKGKNEWKAKNKRIKHPHINRFNVRYKNGFVKLLLFKCKIDDQKDKEMDKLQKRQILSFYGLRPMDEWRKGIGETKNVFSKKKTMLFSGKRWCVFRMVDQFVQQYDANTIDKKTFSWTLQMFLQFKTTNFINITEKKNQKWLNYKNNRS